MSVRLDLHNLLDYKSALDIDEQAANNTQVVGNIIDRQGFHALEFVIITGLLVDTDATFSVLVEDGDDSGLSDAAAVPDADLLGTEADAGFTFAADNTIAGQIGYVGAKRFVRISITPAANTGLWDCGVTAVQSQRVA